MNIFIRVFYGNSYKDISLQPYEEYAIGSQTFRGLEIANSKMASEQIILENKDGSWKVTCNGEVYLNGNVITQAELLPSQTYILSRKDRISMLVLEEYSFPIKTAPLNSAGQIIIGRKEENDIVLRNGLVAGEQALISRKGTELYIADRKSTNGTYVNGEKISETILKENDEIVICGYKLKLENNSLLIYGNKKEVYVKTIAKKEGKKDGIIFERSPRLQLDIPTGEIEIQSPPNIGSKPESDKVSMILPLAVTVGIAVVMSIFMSPMMLIYSLPMQAISGFMSYRNYKKQTKSYAEKEDLRLGKYTQHIEEITKEIEKKSKEQLAALNNADPNTAECFEIVEKISRRLWERRPSDKDFLSVRVGSGEIDFAMKINIPKDSLSLEDDELKNKPKEIYNKYRKLQNAPITCSLLEFPVLGVVGHPTDTSKLVRNMVAQITTHHCYTEVKVVTVSDKMSAEKLEFVKYLPHSYANKIKQPYIAKTKAEAEECFKNFEGFFKKRKIIAMEDNSYGKKMEQLPYYLFVITAPNYLTKSNPINEYLFKSRGLGLGVGVIFAVEDIVQLPPECEMIAEVKGKEGKIYNKYAASSKQEFFVDDASTTSFEKFGRKMMPIYCEVAEETNTIPTKYSFYEMLGISKASQLNIGERWSKSDITKNVSAPLGIYGQNQILHLDLLESAHGPHGLMAGKTGSGKSEVLLSYLVALASLYSPEEIAFVVIDFKGGASADRLRKLPHFNAAITNIDGNASGQIDAKVINRSLAAINAESLRRQKLLSEVGAKDIGEYIEKYKEGIAKRPLPHLIMFVDEFAELKQQYPEFMKELVSIARTGRSAGMHLILATQSPAGVVDKQIWDNSNFKLSLMVLDESNSNAVIQSPLAAHISNPGRGYLKVGNNTLFELFQSGYSGIKITDDDGKERTQLEAVIKRIKEYCDENGIKGQPSICLPPLPVSLEYDANKTNSKNGVIIGKYDDTENQYQGEYNLPIFAANTMIIGSSSSGKTNLMQNIIRGIATNYTPDEVSMYIIDFSSMILRNFEGLNHVGGVVTQSEDEKLKNLFKLLNYELEYRKEKQLTAGVSSFVSYREAGYTDIPAIVVFVENLTALKELYLQDDDMLVNLCANGLNCGITFVIANSQTSGIGYKYLAHFANRIALYCNDSSEYMSLFEHCREKINDIAGRGLIEINKRFYECQTYLAFNGEIEKEKTEHIKEMISYVNSLNSSKAKPIPVVPELIKLNDVKELALSKKNDSYSVLLGIDYATVEPLFINMNSLGLVGISGKEGSGKHNFIKYLIGTLDEVYKGKTEVHIIDSINRKLADYEKVDNVKSYTILSEFGKQTVSKIEQELEQRYNEIANGNIDVLSESKLIVLILNSTEILDEMCADNNTISSLRNIVGKYKSMNVCVIVGNYENKNIPYAANEFVKKIKEDKHLMFFDNLSNLKIFDVPLAISRKFKKPLSVGDCYYMKDNECIKIKSILNE